MGTQCVLYTRRMHIFMYQNITHCIQPMHTLDKQTYDLCVKAVFKMI